MAFGPDNRLQHDIAGTLGNGTWGYIVGTYDKDTEPNNQRLYLNGTRVAQMSDTLPHRPQLSCPWHRPACERHRRPLQRPYRRVPHLPRPALRRLDREHLEQHERPRRLPRQAPRSKGGEPPPLAGAGVVVCLMG
jgi:hypothetical protein